MDLRRMRQPKEPDARFTLALLGASKMVKDPRWAIEVLRRLREHDERYRLLLIGGKFQDPSAATSGYAEALHQDLAELEPRGAVERISFTDDVPGALRRAGVIMSTSVRESFHIGLVEGAASGAVPVVRDWPFFPGAPRTLFPGDWVVDSPEQAVERVLELTATEDAWRDAGTAASAHALGRWDWSVVRRDWERLLRR
jgi:glycosyltransferase involved in cell wall biosynthesis